MARAEDFQEAVRISSVGDLNLLTSFLESSEVDDEAKFLAVRAFGTPAAAVGVCAICGADLQFTGHPDELRVCCVGREPHCWNMTGAPLP